MAAAASPDALALLVTAVDEMRETTSLIPVARGVALARIDRGSSNFGMLFARSFSSSEVNAGQRDAVPRRQRRATLAQHWREALSVARRSATPAQRQRGRRRAWQRSCRPPDWTDVLPRLELEAIPRPTNKAAVHLAAVVETIHDCEHLASDRPHQAEPATNARRLNSPLVRHPQRLCATTQKLPRSLARAEPRSGRFVSAWAAPL